MYEMIILLLFNKHDQWTPENIFNQTQIKTEFIIEILNSFIKSKLLICSQVNCEDFKDNYLHMGSTIQLASHFQKYAFSFS